MDFAELGAVERLIARVLFRRFRELVNLLLQIFRQRGHLFIDQPLACSYLDCYGQFGAVASNQSSFRRGRRGDRSRESSAETADATASRVVRSPVPRSHHDNHALTFSPCCTRRGDATRGLSRCAPLARDRATDTFPTGHRLRANRRK